MRAVTFGLSPEIAWGGGDFSGGFATKPGGKDLIGFSVSDDLVSPNYKYH
jgi:hypothetical protein